MTDVISLDEVKNHTWGQISELNFIRRMGTVRIWKDSDGVRVTREVAHERACKRLRGYIASIPHRDQWFRSAKPRDLQHAAEFALDGLMEPAPSVTP